MVASPEASVRLEAQLQAPVIRLSFATWARRIENGWQAQVAPALSWEAQSPRRRAHSAWAISKFTMSIKQTSEQTTEIINDIQESCFAYIVNH
jgi:hypothetical protein